MLNEFTFSGRYTDEFDRVWFAPMTKTCPCPSPMLISRPSGKIVCVVCGLPPKPENSQMPVERP